MCEYECELYRRRRNGCGSREKKNTCEIICVDEQRINTPIRSLRLIDVLGRSSSNARDGIARCTPIQYTNGASSVARHRKMTVGTGQTAYWCDRDICRRGRSRSITAATVILDNLKQLDCRTCTPPGTCWAPEMARIEMGQMRMAITFRFFPDPV